MEPPEFRYDEFGFRVDKEGKREPLVCNLAAVPTWGGLQLW